MGLAYILDDCGLFWYDGPTRYALPLEGVHVSARIVNMVAEVQVVQFYVNNSHRTIDTKYEFPLDESAAVCGFEAELEDKLLIGEVREKEEARMEYNAAIARGETAALLEQSKPDVFVQKIGNIRPHSRVNIRITYVADLKVESDGAVRFVLPTSVAPRYSPYQPAYYPDYVLVPWRRPWHACCLGRRVLYYDDYVVWRRRVPVWEELPWHPWPYYKPEYVVNRDKPCAFSVTLEIEMPSAVTNLESPTHTLKWEKTANGASASFWYDTEPMGKDLVLRIAQEKPHEPHAELEVAPDGSGCAMVSMVPEFDLEPEPTEIIFLVDCSGSMNGQRINAAKNALGMFLRALPMSCYFNIFKFGSRFVNLWGSSSAYTEKTLKQALEYVGRMGADLGGTELKQPLDQIFKNKVAAGRGRQVFVLTDGQVNNTQDVIELCRRNAHNSRVFSVGIGDEVSRHLVEGMARGTSGTAEFIQGVELNSSGGALERKLLNQLKLATMPAINKVFIEWGQLGKVEPSFQGIANSAAPSSAPSSTPSSTPTPTPTPTPAEAPHAIFQLNVATPLQNGESLFVVGTCGQLGSWQTSAAVPLTPLPSAGAPGGGSLLSMFSVGSAGPTEFRSGPVFLPSGPQEFKFIRRQASGNVAWEEFQGNRIVNLERNALVECGMWGSNTVQVLPLASSPATPTPQPTPAPAPSAVPLASSGGPMMSSVPLGAPSIVPGGGGARPVSRFFQSGPRNNNANAVGSGPGIHSPSILAPGVSAYNDASASQALGRNESFYQAPFLPPPIFSGARFVMYAFFQPGACPNGSIKIRAEGPEGEMDIDVPITKLTGAGRTLHTLAARALIRDLEEGTSHLHWRKSYVAPQARSGGSGEPEHHWFRGWMHVHTPRAVGGKGQDRGSAWSLEPVTPPANAVRNELIELGTRYGITSSATSFVAVERWLDGRSGSSDVPLPLPSQQVPQTLSQQQQQQQPTFNSFVGGGYGGGGAGRGGAPPAAKSLSMSRSRVAAPAAPASFSSSFSAGGPPPPPAAYGAPPPASGGAPMWGAPAQSAPLAPRRSSSSMPMAQAEYASDKMEKRKKSSQKFDRSLRKEKEEMARPAFAADMLGDSSDGEDEDAGPSITVASPTALLQLQSFDGSFSPSPQLWAIIGQRSLAAPAELSKLSGQDLEKVLTSIYVLIFLERNMGASRDLWEMNAEKCRSWCFSTLARVGLDRATARSVVDNLIRTL